LQTLFALFRRKNLSLSPKKSFLGYHSVKLLGFRVDELGTFTTESRIRAIKELQFPSSLQQLERVIGMTAYLRHLVPKYSQRINPLQRRKTAMIATARTDGKRPNGTSRKHYTQRAFFTPTEEVLASFKDLQTALSAPNAIFHQDPNRALFIQLDAYKEKGFSGVCFQLADGYVWDGRSPIPRS
jgi:hypothetical protein